MRSLACMIIDQCSNVFFDRTQPLDLRPEVMDIFAETLGDVNYYTTTAFKLFWQNVESWRNSENRDWRNAERLTKTRDHQHSKSNRVRQSQKYLDINLEGTLLREAQDIAEELKIMISIYSKQLGVVKSFQKCLEQMNGNPKSRNKSHLASAVSYDLVYGAKEPASSHQNHRRKPPAVSIAEMDFLDDLVEEVEDRKAEIMDLEKAAQQTCQQVSGFLPMEPPAPADALLISTATNGGTQLQELLSLKQQQASIVAAQAALDNAEVSIDQAQESIQQGKSIMAFTIMTIIFVSQISYK
jgi:hypothetical protein